MAKVINEEAKGNQWHFVDELDVDVMTKVASFASCSICPMSAFFGGIIAQEIVKFTGKYSPMKQWLHYDCFEALPDKEVNRTPFGNRYDDQIKIFGRETQAKLAKVNTFMVGSGALGCELLKAFVMMGVGCGPEGKVHNTDNDNIEISNLNR
jgi:ubiquitin-activating enzyme E1